MPIYADHWHFPQFHKTVIPYMIASNCEEVALFLNGKRFYTARPAECANRMITGFIPWQPGTVEAIGYLGGNEVCRHTVKTPGPAVQTVFDQESVKAEACEGYEILLTARACDEDGTPYFRESTLVRFRVEGPVKIVGVDSGNLMSSEPCTEEFIHMYRGCASVVIRLTGEPGRIAVYADAEGMKSGVAVIAVAEKE